MASYLGMWIAHRDFWLSGSWSQEGVVIRTRILWTRCAPVWCAFLLVFFAGRGIAGDAVSPFSEDPRLDARSRIILEDTSHDPEYLVHFVLEGVVDPLDLEAVGGRVVTRA